MDRSIGRGRREPCRAPDYERMVSLAMTEIQKRLATGKGKFTPLYPDLGNVR